MMDKVKLFLKRILWLLGYAIMLAVTGGIVLGGVVSLVSLGLKQALEIVFFGVCLLLVIGLLIWATDTDWHELER